MLRRRWRWVGVALVVALGLFVAADVIAVRYLESRGAAELARSMSAEEAELELGGFPFLPRYLRGRLTDVALHVQGASASGGLRVDSFRGRMGEARFSPGAMWSLAGSIFATRTKVVGVEPISILELTQSDLEEYIRRTTPLVGDLRVRATGIEIRFIAEGADLVEGQEPTKEDLTKPARYLPRVVEGRVVLSLISIVQVSSMYRSDAFRLERIIDLPRIPSSLRTDVSLRDRVLVIEAQGSKVSLKVGEGERRS